MRQSVLVSVKANETKTRGKATTMDRPVSDELKALLGRQRMRGETAGTGTSHGRKSAGGLSPRVSPGGTGDWMRWANDILDREGDVDEDHSPAGGEELRPVTKPRVRIVRAMPFLAVMDGGRR